MVNDTISDMLTRIRNACLIKKRTVLIKYTRITIQIVDILEKEGLINSYEILSKKNIKNIIQNAYISKEFDFKEIQISLKYYTKYKTQYYKLTTIKDKKAQSALKNQIKFLQGKQGRHKTSCITNLRRISKPGLRIYANNKELPRILGGAGIVILSTSKGIMTDREARFRRIGGELLCSVW